MSRLSELIQGGAVLEDIARHLDAFGSVSKRQEVLSLRRDDQFKLFELAAQGARLAPEELVPGGSKEVELLFEGRNSMPAFSRFQKGFFRSTDGRLFGRNVQTFSWLTGPGYFEVLPSPRSANELLLDYAKIPAAVPAGLPAPRSNDDGVGRLVFGGMNDYLRRVAAGVLIGWAFKDGKDLKTTFVLAR